MRAQREVASFLCMLCVSTSEQLQLCFTPNAHKNHLKLGARCPFPLCLDEWMSILSLADVDGIEPKLVVPYPGFV